MKLAAEKGDARSQYELAMLYEEEPQAKSYKNAYLWYTIAEASGHQLAHNAKQRVEGFLDESEKKSVLDNITEMEKTMPKKNP